VKEPDVTVKKGLPEVKTIADTEDGRDHRSKERIEDGRKSLVGELYHGIIEAPQQGKTYEDQESGDIDMVLLFHYIASPFCQNAPETLRLNSFSHKRDRGCKERPRERTG
jgi:hypothetical protein